MFRELGSVRPGRDARVHGGPAGGARVRVEEGGAPMGLEASGTSCRWWASGKDGSPSFLTTKLDFVVNWARRNSLWPMPFGTACCAIEMMASYASRFDLARFGMERMSFSPRQADLLICAGRVTVQDGAGAAEDLGPDAAAEVVDLHGRVRVFGRRVRRLLHGAGDRHDHPGGRVRARLPAAARGSDLRDPDAAGEDQGRVAERGSPRADRGARTPSGRAGRTCRRT